MGAVVSMVAESDVEAPLDLAFGYVTDWANAPKFVPGLKRWTPVEEGPPREGARFHVEIGASLGTVTGELEIVRYEPNVAIEWKGLSGPQQSGGWVFSPLPAGEDGGERCHVRFELSYTPRLTGMMGRALNKPVEAVVKSTLQQAASKLREQVEALARQA